LEPAPLALARSADGHSNCGQLPAHPASNTYFSMAPIRFGKYVAKYRAKPAGDLLGSFVDLVAKLGKHPDALRQMLEETLRLQQVLFEFQVQLQTSAQTMPVEDATVQWPESESPYHTVALFLIPRQETNTEEQKAICKQLSFNVWHAVADHRPLGGINRLRREAYPISAGLASARGECAAKGKRLTRSRLKQCGEHWLGKQRPGSQRFSLGVAGGGV
jgi:hypothetical protein